VRGYQKLRGRQRLTPRQRFLVLEPHRRICA